jgi:hypothetical protein
MNIPVPVKMNRMMISSANIMSVQLEKGVEILFQSFGRLDSRISGVGQTAARIGDHLQVW